MKRKHSMALTNLQEQCCQEYKNNRGNKYAAYKKTYKCDNWTRNSIDVQANKFFKNPKVIIRLEQLGSESAKRNQVTVDSISKEYDEARQLAEETKSPAAMVAATTGKAKLHGLVVDKSVNKNLNTEMTIEQWLADLK